MEITYTNTRRDQIVQAQALLRDPLSSFAFYHYSWVLYWAAMAALGAYVSLFVGLVFIACIFIAMFLLYAVVALPFRGSGSGQHGRPVVGVRVSTSACVWTSKGFTRPLKELLRASLRGVPSAASPSSTAIFSSSLPVTFWANIPRARVAQGDAAFEEVVQSLRAGGVVEQPSNQAMQRTAPRSNA